jgi:hypothetical protein
MLQNEQRRLKEEDIRNLRERQKRLQMKRKQEIMNKDTQSTEYLKLIKESEDFIQQKLQ